ncbi:MAG: flagellar FlbD family protein [Firmicutes bacterium]|nr:flagellar FlbD family protein [Bacillota bacterium]
MVKVRRLNGEEIVISADMIEAMEATPDTVITLTNGKRFVVKDSVDDVIRKVVEYKRGIFGFPWGCPPSSPGCGSFGG